MLLYLRWSVLRKYSYTVLQSISECPKDLLVGHRERPSQKEDSLHSLCSLLALYFTARNFWNFISPGSHNWYILLIWFHHLTFYICFCWQNLSTEYILLYPLVLFLVYPFSFTVRSMKSRILATYPDAFPDESTSEALDRRPDLEMPQ